MEKEKSGKRGAEEKDRNRVKTGRDSEKDRQKTGCSIVKILSYTRERKKDRERERDRKTDREKKDLDKEKDRQKMRCSNVQYVIPYTSAFSIGLRFIEHYTNSITII